MNDIVALCFPTSDADFRARVRAFLDAGSWELDSPEGVALLQALLRESFPVAAVVHRPHEVMPGVRIPRVVEVYRDGLVRTVNEALAVRRTRRSAWLHVDLEAPGMIIAAWRDAERRVAAAPAGSDEELDAREDAEACRAGYHRAFRGLVSPDEVTRG